MEQLSEEEFSKLPFKKKKGKEKKINWGKSSPFYIAIMGLSVGGNVKIYKSEWNLYRTPKRMCSYIAKKFPGVKYDCFELADDSGWGIKRVE
jgi:hypothetical protein